MLTTLLDGLLLLGRETLRLVWVPVLAWTVLALPIWWGVERAGRLHPLVTYRIHQVLLASLPFGVLAAAVGLSWTGAPSPLVELPTLTVGGSSLSIDALGSGRSGASTVSWHWTQGVGLGTVAAGLASVAAIGQLVLDALAALHVRATARRLSPSVQTRVRRLLHATGLRRSVGVFTHADTEVPVTVGGPKPVVLLPTSLLQSPESLRMALAHESVHLRRYDDIAHLLERLVVAVFTIHPFVHRLFADIEHARERACDAAVLSDPTVPPAAYARLLSTFATGSTAPTGALSLSESSSLIDRLRAMRSLSSLSAWPTAALTAGTLAVGVALVFGVVACSDSLTSPAAEETTSASSSTPTQRSGDGPYVVVEDPPRLKGGLAALQEEITYPKLARKAGIEGRVFVKFVVGTDGAVQNPTVTRGVHKLLNEEALRAVKNITFEPGRQRGEPVRVQMSLPVTFQLPDSATTESDTGISPDASSETDSQIEDRVQNAFRSVQYPDLLRKAGVEGRVVVTFTIGPSGQIQDPRVAESAHEALDTAALQVVQNLTFDGTGQSTDVTLPITFSRSNEEGAEIRYAVNAR